MNNDLAERKVSIALNEYQGILGLFGDNLGKDLGENHIQVFMGKSHMEVEIMEEIMKDMIGYIRELEKMIRGLTDKIQSKYK